MTIAANILILTARVSMDTSAPVWAKASGATITLVPRVPDTPLTVSGSTTYDTGHFGSGSFAFGSASGTTVSPTLVLHCTPSSIGPSQVTNCTASITGDDAELGTYAPVNPIVFTINSSSWTTVAVSPDGDAVAEGGLSGASPGTYTISASYSATSPYTDSYYPAMSVSTTVTVGSSDPTTTGVYQYKIKQSDGTTSGFDAAGNITAYYDSTSGQWNNIQYDALNRLVRADGPSAFNGSSPYFCWTYDSFGNRTGQNSEPTGPFTVVSTVGSQSCTAYSGVTATTDVESYSSGDASNQLRSSSHLFGIERSGSASYDYDAAGELTDDGAAGHQYAYDAEGRLCAEYNGTAYIGYLYNASGIRVAKGTQSSLSCDLTGNGFTMTSMYVLDQGGQTMTETDGSGVWQHTDVGGFASYDSNGLHFQMADWLGTRRVQTDYAGTVETSFQHLPFGELLTSLSGDSTEKHFTGKEHDTESGNDYFDARYYSPSMGRFMIPDWSVKVEPIPYSKLDDPQSLNLYSYVRNHPLSTVDADGHDWQEVLKHLGNAINETTGRVTVGFGLGAKGKVGGLDARAEVAYKINLKFSAGKLTLSETLEGGASIGKGKNQAGLAGSVEKDVVTADLNNKEIKGSNAITKEYVLGTKVGGNQSEASRDAIGVSGEEGEGLLGGGGVQTTREGWKELRTAAKEALSSVKNLTLPNPDKRDDQKQ